ncbi:hypothetical protein D918_03913 [Trichuris suis]|nr:hypothetical protein D918_03913 [Trichuris suis]
MDLLGLIFVSLFLDIHSLEVGHICCVGKRAQMVLLPERSNSDMTEMGNPMSSCHVLVQHKYVLEHLKWICFLAIHWIEFSCMKHQFSKQATDSALRSAGMFINAMAATRNR